MLTVSQALRSTLLYPINPATVESYLISCGIEGEAQFTQEIAQSADYKRVLAKCYIYYADSPQVSEAGASYNFTDEQRKEFRRKADALLDEIGEGDNNGVIYGWQGEFM